MAAAGATKTAEQMNQERRIAKHRQQQVAKAKALGNIKGKGEFNLQDAVQERRSFECKRAFIEQRAKENGDRLMKDLLQYGVLKLDKPTLDINDYVDPFEFDKLVKHWRNNCFDVISAAKRSDQRFTWNRDWQESGRLLIAPVKK